MNELPGFPPTRKALMIAGLALGLMLSLGACERQGAAEAAEDAVLTALPQVEPVVVDSLPQLSQRIDDLAALGGFNGAVLASRGDTVLFRKVYGTANHEREQPMALDTRFRIASVSKQFTSAAILRLQDQGILSVDDPVCRWIQPCPDAWAPVRISHLLSHTSGIPDLMQRPRWGEMRRTHQTPEQLTAASAEYSLSFEPGTRFRYSNAGYNLAGAIVTAATGRDYLEFLRSEFFDPLGMENTGFDDGTEETAMGYAWLAGGRTPQPDSNASIVYASGGLYSTVDDLLTWTRALHGGRLLSAAGYRAMTTPHNPPEETPAATRRPRGVGYGLYMADLGARMEPGFLAGQIYHTGSWAGFRALVTYHPATDTTVVALSNYYSQRDALVLITQQAIAEVVGAPLPDRIGTS